MNFLQYDLGSRSKGEVVQVTLSGNAANVRLLDSGSLQSYRSGRQHKYYGGFATRSPVQIPIPSSGRWYIVVDFGGHSGNSKASVKVLPGRLPQLREPSLSSLPSLVRGGGMPFGPDESDGELHDVFISHASEDKVDVVRPLANALRNLGLKVWYDEFELRLGDSLRRKIDKGLTSSRFGVVVLSQSFLKKGWTNYELDGLVTKAVAGEQILLPIWHNISKAEVMSYSASLADKVARSTATHTVEEIAAEIFEVIKGADIPSDHH